MKDNRNRRPTKPSHDMNPKKSKPVRVEKGSEVKICGVNACRALFAQRPNDIVRVYVTKEMVKEFGDLLKWCAANRKAYHIVEAKDLEKIAATVHHQSVCILAKRQAPASSNSLVNRLRDGRAVECILFLDGIQNPHNCGAILRVCSHFGIKTVLIEEDKVPKLSPAAYRTAQGGAEDVELIPIDDPVETLKALKGFGYQLCSTSDQAKTSLFKQKLSPRVVFMLGSESSGLTKKYIEIADVHLLIPHSGQVKSLNVASAASIFIAEQWRQHH